MGKTKTSGKGRLDKFYYLAKEQGYRSRAAFKLVQLNRKYHFLEGAHSLLDLCAAPGGWLQVAVKYMPVGSLIIGVDLVPIRAIRGVSTLTEDITTPKCRTEIKKLLKSAPLDVVLHDGSPNVGGAWSKEALSQLSLTLDALKLACAFLKPGGMFVTKVFRSEDYHALIQSFKQLFKRVEATKPLASRATSAEIYVICSSYKAPPKLDPHLFDVKHVFKESIEPPKIVDVLSEGKRKRHRDGYEDGVSILHKSASVLDFISSPKPVEFLGSFHDLLFASPQCDAISAHESTDGEVKALCADLRVLGKSEFKHLLKWRVKIRKAFPALCSAEQADGAPPAAIDAAGGEGEDEEEEEEKEDEALEDLHAMVEAGKKRLRKAAKRRAEKLRKSSATGVQKDVVGDDVYGEDGLFSLAQIKTAKHLQQVQGSSAAAIAGDDDQGSDEDDDGEQENDDGSHGQNEGSDDDEEDDDRRRYEEDMESYFDAAYDEYCRTREGSTKRRARARLDNVQDLSADADADPNADMAALPAHEEEESNPLLLPLEPRPSAADSRKKVAEQWFSQDVFQGISLGGLGESKGKKAAAMAVEEESGDFEVVKAEESVEERESGNSSSSSSEEYDSDSKAETLAYAKKMLRKKQREDILDDAYNRYAFDDPYVPKWFAEDQSRFYCAIKPITREEVQAMKEQQRAIDARPVKKVAEAKARKRRVAMKKMEAVRQKATAISEQPDLNSRAKNKLMERLYSKAAGQQRKGHEKEVVVAKKGGLGNRGKYAKGKIMVDKRMLADKRGQKRAQGKKKAAGPRKPRPMGGKKKGRK